MATVHRSIADDLIKRNGKWEDDPQVVKIVQYQTIEGEIVYGIMYEWEDLNRYHESEFVRNPVTIWEFKP